jgi:hypothetical protein
MREETVNSLSQRQAEVNLSCVVIAITTKDYAMSKLRDASGTI